jgi:hypothetical protein
MRSVTLARKNASDSYLYEIKAKAGVRELGKEGNLQNKRRWCHGGVEM